MKNDKLIGNKKIFLLISLSLLSFLLFFSLISAVKPTRTTGEIDIQFNSFDSIKQNRNHTFYFHTSNLTNILSNETVNCDFYLFYQDGTEVLDTDDLKFTNKNEFRVGIIGANFTQLGQYNGLVECNSTTQTGATSFSFDVTPSGFTDNLGFFIVLISIVYFVGFAGFFGRNEWISALGGLGMIALSVYFINEGVVIYRDWFTNGLSYITLGIGVIFTLVPVLESLQINQNDRK